MALIIIILNITEIPGALFDIIQNAFGLKTAVSGGIGAALTRGMRRGFFPIFTRVLDDFRTQIKAGEDRPVFHADKFPDLDLNRTAWRK